MSEKIQKVLSRAGYASRREIERWIMDGRIYVNGRRASVGDRVVPTDDLQLDGEPCQINGEPTDVRVVLYHKPVGEVCTRSDPEGRRTVFESLPKIHEGRWVSVGRLDINSSGLLLFTNDGELANRLMHPGTVIQREYAVRVLGKVDAAMTKRLTHGVMLEDGKARFEDLVDTGGESANRWFHVVVAEGRNRLVRRLWESQGLTVSRLMRVRYGPIIIPKSLREGECTELTDGELKKLVEASQPS